MKWDGVKFSFSPEPTLQSLHARSPGRPHCCFLEACRRSEGLYRSYIRPEEDVDVSEAHNRIRLQVAKDRLVHRLLAREGQLTT